MRPPAPTSVHPFRRQREDGVALVIALLFTAVILMVVVSTTATMTLGTRGGGTNERTAYQALLTAESGLNTFPARTSNQLLSSPFNATTAADAATWLSALGTYGDAQLTFENVALSGTTFTFDVVSTGTQGVAVKRVLQSYSLTKAGLPNSVRPRAALTSLPNILATGNADISGRANDGVATTVSGLGVTLGVGVTTINLPVADTSGLIVGDYIQVSGQTLKITGMTGNTLTVSPVPAALVTAAVLTGNVTLLMNAVATTYGAVTDPMDLRVSNFSDFIVGETVTLGGSTATVESVNAAAGLVRLDWTSTLPTSLAEGAQVQRDITAMRSAWNISPKANKLGSYDMTSGGVIKYDCPTATTCIGANDPLLKAVANRSDFTSMIVGLTDAQLDASLPLSTDTSQMTSNQIRRIPAANFDEVVKNRTSGGILIVDGDVDSNINGNTTFNGFIYFRGSLQAKMNGNFTVNGAVAVAGAVNISSDQTDITGSLDVNYDAAALRRTILVAKGITQVASQQGTWRQR